MATKKQVLVVDDDDQLCELIRATLELEGIEVRDAGHVIEAEKQIAEHVPDAIVLDVGLPGIDGLFYLQRLRENPDTRTTPIVVISGSAQAGVRAEGAGATAYLRKPFDLLDLLSLLQRSMGLTPLEHVTAEATGGQGKELRSLIEHGRRRHELADEAHHKTLMALGSALESRDFGSSDHSERVTAYAVRLALEVDPSLTDDPSLEWGFLLHDVGKISIPDRILLKPGPLDHEERREIEQHSLFGEGLLAAVPLLQGEGLRVVRSHHERWDGTGYPDRLAGADIPLSARIFAVVDALDAMTDTRPYRETVSWDEAIEELRRHAGTQFDPDVIDGVVACEADLFAIRNPSLQPAGANCDA